MGLLKDSRMAADTTTEGPTRAFRSFATASAAEMEDVENKRLQTLNSSMASLGPLPSLATLAQSSAPLSLLARRTSLNNMNTNAVSGGAAGAAGAAAGVATSAASAAANFATSLVSSFSSFSSSLSSSSNSSPTRRPTPVKATTTTTATATATATASATATSTATNSNNGSPNSSRPLTSASASASATTTTTTLGLERAVERMLLLAGSTPSPSFVSANDSASLSEMLFLENDAFAASPVSDPLSASSASSASSAATFDGDFMDECASVAPSDRQWRLARAREHALRELQLSKAAAAEAADAADAAAAAAATTTAAANRSPRNTVRSSSQPCFGSESDTDTSPSRESKDDSDINNSSNSDDSELFSLTPGRRRSVSWGDVSGAGLVDSVCFWQDDAPCRCGKKKEVGAARPKSPYLDSELPLSHRELMRQLSEQGVQLEHSMIRWPLVFLSIRVLNLGFEKSVFLRTSSDGWKTHTDVPASYLEQASDRLTDEFQAALRVPSTTTQDETEFAICCQMNGREYWDNNNGRNYRMQFCHRHQSILGAPSPAGPNACCSPTVPQSPLKPCLKAKPW